MSICFAKLSLQRLYWMKVPNFYDSFFQTNITYLALFYQARQMSHSMDYQDLPKILDCGPYASHVMPVLVFRKFTWRDLYITNIDIFFTVQYCSGWAILLRLRVDTTIWTWKILSMLPIKTQGYMMAKQTEQTKFWNSVREKAVPYDSFVRNFDCWRISMALPCNLASITDRRATLTGSSTFWLLFVTIWIWISSYLTAGPAGASARLRRCGLGCCYLTGLVNKRLRTDLGCDILK